LVGVDVALVVFGLDGESDADEVGGDLAVDVGGRGCDLFGVSGLGVTPPLVIERGGGFEVVESAFFHAGTPFGDRGDVAAVAEWNGWPALGEGLFRGIFLRIGTTRSTALQLCDAVEYVNLTGDHLTG